MQSSDYRIRACYSKRISYSRDELSRILALDTSFIPLFLKSFCRSYKFSVDSQVDRILESIRNTPLWYAIEKDILMLENQVPMFVLIQAFLFITNSQSDTQMVNTSGREITQDDRRFQESNHLDVILQDACLHFNPFIREENYLPQPPDRNSTGHLLDYLYHYVTTASPQHQSNPLQQGCVIKLSKMVSTTTAGYIPSATELSEAGIKFAPYDSGDLRKICFKKTISTFFLPKININDFTEVVLRNLVAFELNLKEKQKPLTRYTFLMGRLIRTEGDVALLQRCGILNCQMDSDAEVARMWNCMCKSIGKNTFDPVEKAIDEAQKYYRSKWRVLLAEFWEKHSSKLWLVIPFLYAGMMLFLQAAQVFCLFHTCNK
ncbi:putative UPF0481 protein At3g02645 [Cryptomeria japonica]|uniref:putative UPF0481 protein At3g02645 n=1 Tax=Cryptomeria japonica TaxID=3369 RepID=UPI0027DA682A|nr:putative UPF0481 protein At3g02645 [Cryptomeria japonica]